MGFWCSLLVEVLGGIVTAVLLGVVVATRDARVLVDSHDREIAGIDEDIRRFLRDRDRVLRVESSITTEQMAARGMLYSGAHLGDLADLRRQALQEYRDEMTRKLRRYREMHEREGRSHLLARRRRSPPRLELSPQAKLILRAWRADVEISAWKGNTAPIDDPTSAEREPALRRFEDLGEPPQMK